MKLPRANRRWERKGRYAPRFFFSSATGWRSLDLLNLHAAGLNRCFNQVQVFVEGAKQDRSTGGEAGKGRFLGNQSNKST